MASGHGLKPENHGLLCVFSHSHVCLSYSLRRCVSMLTSPKGRKRIKLPFPTMGIAHLHTGVCKRLADGGGAEAELFADDGE
jgi:hypothetical protein